METFMKQFFLILLFGIMTINGAVRAEESQISAEPDFSAVVLPPPKPEVWAYIVEGSEKAYTGKEPITDACYFRAIVNYKGELVGAKEFPSYVPLAEGVRKHIVIAELSNTALTHFFLQTDSKIREKLLDDISKSSEGFEGVQIDFESIHCDDKNLFFDFLRDLRKKIGGKMLSVAVPARTRQVKDAFDYDVLRDIADRLIIMAYDEHWKGSNPGPVASIEWCSKVAGYTKSVIPKEKLVMGVPLYGRSWQNQNFSKEVSSVDVKKNGSSKNKSGAANPNMTYERRVKVTVFYETVDSIMKKVKMYRSTGIESVAFWRMGQGPVEVWPQLKKIYPFESKSVK
jgi:spore germination protein